MRPRMLRALGATLLMASGAAFGQSAAEEAQQNAAFEAADRAKVVGPATVALRDQASLKLPEGYLYIPTPAATQVLQAMGSRADERLVGVVFPAADQPWFVAIRFFRDGHVKDHDARDWNTEELLEDLRAGTAAANAERANGGLAPLEVVGWAEAPYYDGATHRLVWSASLRERGRGAADQGVNYNTYALGREGYISLNLITDLDKLPVHRPKALQLLGALEYDAGKRYADFDGSADKVAPYGLATLVAGSAARKPGLPALLRAFAERFSTVLVVAGGVALWGLAMALRRKPEAEIEQREPVLHPQHTRPGTA